ncbi:hypothetical protein [Halomonas stenophila]|uniref:Uncharacterized protein n=1 Tax=Halomonas stenophila TaxID=795312 RepID=A0A7W5EVB9_9GAMM|nr:hypothetical protein [Halomonas stenophila]MBB3231727.1 hypothetical protein [Halomonas stenophila]
MNKWQQLEEQLKGVFGGATILADGHEVTLQKRLDGEKLVIQVGVDGWIRGKWMDVDDQGNPTHPEGRFYCPMRRRAWKLKEYAKLKRVFGKKKADEMTALRTVLVAPHWNSPKTLISHLRKHFPDLELKARDEVAS